MRVNNYQTELHTQQGQEQNKDVPKQNLEFATKTPSFKFKRICLMTQQSHCWAYTRRKPELKETRVPQCSSQHCL